MTIVTSLSPSFSFLDPPSQPSGLPPEPTSQVSSSMDSARPADETKPLPFIDDDEDDPYSPKSEMDEGVILGAEPLTSEEDRKIERLKELQLNSGTIDRLVDEVSTPPSISSSAVQMDTDVPSIDDTVSPSQLEQSLVENPSRASAGADDAMETETIKLGRYEGMPRVPSYHGVTGFLPPTSPDPFSHPLWGKEMWPWTVLREETIRRGASQGTELSAMKTLCLIDLEHMKEQFDKLPPIPGIELNPALMTIESMGITAADEAQLQLYRDNPDAPHLYPLSTVPNRRQPAVPYLESMPNVSTSSMVAVQNYYKERPRASCPGDQLQSPLARSVLISSNAKFVEQTVLPPVPAAWQRDHAAEMAQVQEVRYSEAQKLTWRNCHAEANKYRVVTLPTFRTMMFHRDFNPPGNMYVGEYYNAESAHAELAVRSAVKCGTLLGGGEFSVVAVDFECVQMPHSRTFAQIEEMIATVAGFDSDIRPKHGEIQIWGAEAQMKIAKIVFSDAEMRNWNRGKHPNGSKAILPTNSIEHPDKVRRHNLGPYINNILVGYHQMQNLKQDYDLQSAGVYVCLIQIHAIGGPVLSLQVNHLRTLPPYLANFLGNPNIKKMVIDTKTDGDALYNSYGLPWNHDNGVIDVQRIASNTRMKPHDIEGKLGGLDFGRIIQQFEYLTPRDSDGKARKTRLQLANYCVDPHREGLPPELLGYACYDPVIAHRAWLLLCCVMPDCFFRYGSNRSKESARVCLKLANFTRKVFMQPNQVYSRLFWQYPDEKNEFYRTIPMLRDMQAEQEASLEACSHEDDKAFYVQLIQQYFQRIQLADQQKSVRYGLALVGQNFRSTLQEHQTRGNRTGERYAIFGRAALYYGQDEMDNYCYALIQDREIHLWTEFFKYGLKDGAEYLSSTPFNLLTDLARNRKSTERQVSKLGQTDLANKKSQLSFIDLCFLRSLVGLINS